MTDDQQRPASVSLAFILFLLQLVVAIGGLVVAVVIAQSQRTAESLGAGPVWDGSIALIVPVLELVVVFRMRSGRNWARIVLTVLGVLSIVLAVPAALVGLAALLHGDGDGAGALQSVLVGLRLVSTLVALVAMYTPSANRFFRVAR